MTIPFFILAGELMMKAGIMERLIDLANSVVGRVRGGLAHVTVLAGMGLSTGVGRGRGRCQRARSTMCRRCARSMASASRRRSSPPRRISGRSSASGAMIVYAFMAGPTVSVGGMFMAGVIPALVLVASMLLLVWYTAVKRNYPLTGDPFSWPASATS